MRSRSASAPSGCWRSRAPASVATDTTTRAPSSADAGGRGIPARSAGRATRTLHTRAACARPRSPGSGASRRRASCSACSSDSERPAWRSGECSPIDSSLVRRSRAACCANPHSSPPCGPFCCASPPRLPSRSRAASWTRCGPPPASTRAATGSSRRKSMGRGFRCWPRSVPKIGSRAFASAPATGSASRTWMARAIVVSCRTSDPSFLRREVPMLPQWLLIVAIPVVVLVLVPFIVAGFLRDVDAGTIRMVSWLNGSTVIYRGPGKSKEIPLLTTGTTLSSKVINVDLDITDQTADVDDSSTPRPIKVRVLASAIVSGGDSDTMIKTAANRFFAKPEEEQLSTLTDLMTRSGPRATNLLTHDQLFSAKSSSHGAKTNLPAVAPAPATALVDAEEEDDPLAIIIRKACSRELTDLGLVFNSLNIKVVQSEVAEARRRQSAAEAQANADIVSAQQARRAKEAQLEAERAISDKQRDLEQTKAANAALVAQAEAKRQQAKAGAEKVRTDVEAKARAEALRITTIAEATAESIRRVNQSIQAGGEAYFRYRQIELLPQIAPIIAQGLADAKLVTISGGGAGAPETTAQNITAVIQTALAAQLVTRGGLLDRPADDGEAGRQGNGGEAGAPAAAVPAPELPPAPERPRWQG